MDVFRTRFTNYRNPQNQQACRYFLQGRCRFGDRCRFLHHSNSDRHSTSVNSYTRVPKLRRFHQNTASSSAGSSSSSNNCNNGTNSTTDQEQQTKNNQEDDKTCGICFDVILNKTKREKVFGILPNCNHCFCFTCIRKWRSSKEFDLDVSKACPECRVASDFVYPSLIWLDTKEDKDKFISERKNKMAQVDCKYFRKGRGKCPFGNACLYQHSLPNGKKVDVGPPRPRRDTSTINLSNITDFLFYITNHISDDDDFLDDYELFNDDDDGQTEYFYPDNEFDFEYSDDDDEDDGEIAYYRHHDPIFLM